MQNTDDLQSDGPVEHVDVLIVGGSLVGLATAAFLGHHGVRAVVVERRPDLWVHPRAWGYNPRTMEILTEIGLLEQIDAAGPDTADYRDIIKVDSLAGEELSRYEPDHLQMAHRSFEDLSPAPYSLCAQNRLEPILYGRAEELGADLRYGTELTEFTDTGEAVEAEVSTPEGTTQRLRASYLVAADGHKGSVRTKLGIDKPGMRGFATIMNVLFSADLSEQLRGRTFALCHVERPEGALINMVDRIRGNASDQWQLHIPYDPAQEGPEDFTEERLVAAIRAAAGAEHIEPHIIQALPWEVSGLNSLAYHSGRVFLVGDAAHVMPPAGAFGANTGIHDGHNLAWKLAAVLRGDADPALLDSYDIERRPVAGFTVEQALLRAAHQFMGGDKLAEKIVDDRVIMFGHRYRSAAVPGGGQVDEFARPYESTTLDGQPGTRVPYVRLDRTGTKSSTLEMVGPRLLVLAGPDGQGWVDHANAVAAELDIGLSAHRVAPAEETDAPLRDVENAFVAAAGVGGNGALLVRPDGIVAWRTDHTSAESGSTLGEALRAVLGR